MAELTLLREPQPVTARAAVTVPAVASQAADLRVLRALSAGYLLVPVALFAYGWLRPAYALAVVVVVVAGMAAVGWECWRAVRAGRGLAPPNDLRAAAFTAAPAVLMLLAWLLLSGIAGLGYQNGDYRASNALFKQLIVGDWPLTFDFQGQRVPVVYYVGYYLPAAAVGKLLGWGAANAALWVWSAVGVGLAIAWFARLSRVPLAGRPLRLLGLAVLFCLAGGLDFLALTGLRGALPEPTEHLEFWASAFQYSSQTTLLYWVPQHALAAWLVAALVFDALYHPHDLRFLGLSLAAGLLWSPLGVIGLVPFWLLLAGLSLSPARRRLALRPAALVAQVAALGLAAVVGAYLGANRVSFPIGWPWESTVDRGHLVRLYLAFWWAEVWALAGLLVVYLGLRAGWRRGLGAWLASLEQRFGLSPIQMAVLALSLATLTLLPLFRLGYNNDLSMRGSIPSLFALWLITGQVLLRARDHAPPAQWSFAARQAYGVLVLVVLGGFLPALAEVARSVQNYTASPPPLEAVLAMSEADHPNLVAQRAGDPEAFFFRVLSR